MIKKIFFLILFVNISYSNNLFKIDKNNIKLEADEIRIYKDNKKINLFGNVIVDNGNNKLYADKMTVNFINKNNSYDITEITGYGNILLKGQDIDAKSDKFTYKMNKSIITLYENVVLKEKDSIVYGNKLVYNTTNGYSKIDGENNKKRVKIIINDIDDLKKRYDNE